ncbi:MAG: phosphoheptose isomerase, partial [Actinomycetia bacterium]|nr:phosphoheptose isomerase [Actinomycetes bacterium]
KGIVPIDGGPFPSAATDGSVIAIDALDGDRADMVLTTRGAYDIAGAMFIFELATAIAGEILGIHPFNQPDVEIAKRLAASAMAGELAESVRPSIAVADDTLVRLLESILTEHRPSYVSIQAYLAPSPSSDVALESLRKLIDARCGVYTTVGYGPRFLHSTGQIHKGGPPGAVFIQILDEPQATLRVPETDFTFNELIAAQAAGDRAALADKGRSVLSVQLGQDTETGLRLLIDAARAAFQ